MLFAALCPALAFALSETYQGQLIPRNNDAPISIVVQIDERGGFLTGKVKTSAPLNSDATLDGRNVAGYCKLASAVSRTASLRLAGNCSTSVFEGNYIILYARSKKSATGTFRLTRKTSLSEKQSASDVAASGILACIKSNSRCLTACPRGDESAEYLCANHCRTKLQACKAKAGKLEAPE